MDWKRNVYDENYPKAMNWQKFNRMYIQVVKTLIDNGRLLKKSTAQKTYEEKQTAHEDAGEVASNPMVGKIGVINKGDALGRVAVLDEGQP